MLTPEVARLQSAGNRSEIIRVSARAAVGVGALFLPLFVYLMLAAPEFVTVCFTVEYSASVGIFRINLLELLIVLIILDPINCS